MIQYHRRDFLKIGTLALAGTLLPLPVLAAVSNRQPPDRTLAFYNTHTNEAVSVCYFKKGVYQPRALEKINRVLRDHRTNEFIAIDTDLLDLLHTVQRRAGCSNPFHVISGYRSPATNEMLRSSSSGVASTSLHTHGKAIDIRLPGCSTKKLHNVCIGLQAGGVGYYPQSNFVHVDTGRIRTW